MEQNKTARTITIKELWQIFVYRLWVMLLAATLIVGAFFVYRTLTFTPRYSSTAMMYILRQTDNENKNSSTSASQISSDITAALKVVNDCDILLKSDTVLGAVRSSLDLEEEYESLESLRRSITTENPTDTRILKITVEADTPEMAKNIVDAICEIGIASINEAMGFEQVNMFEYGVYNPNPCNKTSLQMYFLLGLIVAVGVYGIFLVAYFMDDTIKTEEDCQIYLGVGVIGDIPDADEANRKKYGGYYRRYYRRYYRHYGYKYKSRYANPYKAEQKETPVENNAKEEAK